MSNGFKKFAYRNLERNDGYDQFLNVENLAHSVAKSKQYIRTQSCIMQCANFCDLNRFHSDLKGAYLLEYRI